MTPLGPVDWKRFSGIFDDLSLPENFFHRAERYLAALAEVNAALNLVAFDPRREGPAHVVDSLRTLGAIPADAHAVIDVGTGGGFPGLPVALARPDLRVVLLDSLRKKQAAVAGLAVAVGAGNAEALWGRAEDLGRDVNHREAYDVALCRAVGRLPTVLELTLPLVRVGGRCVLHRGQEAPQEVSAAVPKLADLGARLVGQIAYRLPGNDHDRFIVCIEKSDQIDIRFPRRSGVPAKRPLW
ncbi:MAG: 16S rRNA (guanine(527)-N(7))-methyltransferase RsmG [Elusimicrobia bacterium]|nr:MAG: 16S rRNA (guanine(527)-N(7))-methyltransferase RsmG [Elusimicrobiota bacterium]